MPIEPSAMASSAFSPSEGTGGKPTSASKTGRLTQPPDRVLFELLYEQQTAQDQVEVLPHLLSVDAAHVVMLARTGLLPENVAASLLLVNRELAIQVAEGKVAVPAPVQHRGLYLLYEQEYVRRLGKEIGGAAHMARSRNDINATVTRLRVRDDLIGLLAEFCQLSHVMTDAAEKHTDAVMCGFTHLQPAQPGTLGHYFAGILFELTRTAETLDRAYETVNCSPMGAAAGLGTSFPIDREEVAALLGFSGVIENSADAVASRDYLIHILASMAVLGVTLTRLATDLQSWSSAAYGFLGWPDELVSTSSIMPQKRNAFVLENIRGRAIHPVGSLVNTLMGMKNVPFTNSVEMSAEASSHVWAASKALLLSMKLTRLVLERLETSSQRMIDFLENQHTTMTAVADLLVTKHRLGFRSAHDSVSQLVNRFAIMPPVAELKVALEGIVREVLNTSVSIDERELAQALDPAACARAAIYGGGPGPDAVRSQVRALRDRSSLIQNRLQYRRQLLSEAHLRLQTAAKGIVNCRHENAQAP